MTHLTRSLQFLLQFFLCALKVVGMPGYEATPLYFSMFCYHIAHTSWKWESDCTPSPCYSSSQAYRWSTARWKVCIISGRIVGSITSAVWLKYYRIINRLSMCRVSNQKKWKYVKLIHHGFLARLTLGKIETTPQISEDLENASENAILINHCCYTSL